MPSLNFSTISGHLGSDAETRYTPKGNAVVNFTVATSRKYNDKEFTDWTKVTSWGDSCANLRKGDAVIAVGRMQTRSWEGKEGKKIYVTELIADEVGLVLRGSDTRQRDKTQGTRSEQQQYPAQPGYDPKTADPDDIPF